MNKTKHDLAYAYRILDYLKMDDHTYTHLSARSEKGFFIQPFGLLFSEVTEDNLLEVTFDGEIISGIEENYNQTGYITHSSIYSFRPEIQAVFHLHTPEIVAVSAHKDGLLPVSQWALHFYQKISYHKYQSLLLSEQQGNEILQDLGQNYVMLMHNHGALICGRTIHEALFYAYHLQQACRTQCLVLSMSGEAIIPEESICKTAVNDLLSFEIDLGLRDWQAWLRKKLLQ